MVASGNHAKSGRGGPWGGEACSSVIPLGLWSTFQTCPSDALVKLVYPLHLLMRSPSPWTSDSDFSLYCKVDKSSYLHNHPSRPATVVPSPRTKWCWSPEWEAEADYPREPTPQRQRQEDPLAGHLGDSHHEAFCKDSELAQWISRPISAPMHWLSIRKIPTNSQRYSRNWQRWLVF